MRRYQHSGTVSATIDGKVITNTYRSLPQRSVLIAGFKALALEEKKCSYTIAPNDPVFAPIRSPSVNITPLSGSCSLAIANQVRMLYIPFHERLSQRKLAKMFGIGKYDVQKILMNRNNSPMATNVSTL